MDIVEQLNQIEDPELQALLTHAVRYALTHNLIASQAMAAKDNPQANQASVIHKETAVILNALVSKLVEDNKPAPVKAKGKKAAAV
jgi:hypothetical protein